MIDHARRRLADGQDGLVAIIVALVLVVLLLITAFTVDFGLVYSTRSALQNSSDAAALGAASEYLKDNLACPNFIPVTFRAQDAANALREANRADSTLDLITVECSPSGQVDVRYTSAASTPVILGGVAGVDDDYISRRTAVATMGVAQSVPGFTLRPFAICSAGIPDLATSAGGLVVVDYDELVASGECPQGQAGKDWWVVNCPSFDGAPSGDSPLAIRVASGCENGYRVVPGQAAFVGDPAGLSAHLQAACNTAPGAVDDDCLGSGGGNASANNVVTAWAGLLNTRVALPVLCGTVDPSGPACTPSAVVADGTDVAQFPVHRFVGARVCAVRFGLVDTRRSNDVGPCNGTAAEVAAADAAGRERYMIVRFEPMQVVSPIDTACSLGTPRCDGGVRTVSLTE